MPANKKPKPRASAKKKKQLTRGERIIAFIHRYIRVPEGEYAGQPLILEDFQKKWILRVFDNPHGTKKAILSMARKNAKTALMACLILAFLVGPEARLNAKMNSAAMSKEQATIIFDQCVKMIELSAELSKLIRIKESLKILVGLPMNVEFEALSAEAKTKHGLSPLIVIVDELGQVVGPSSDLYNALETAQGAYEDSMMFIISTQAATDADLLSIIIDDAITSEDPRIVCELHTAPEGCDLMDRKAWAAANPAMGLFRSEQDIEDQAVQAVRMPSKEANFRNLILNQRISTSNPAIARSEWKACAGELPPIEECINLTAGLDLSGKFDLTALVIEGFHPASGLYPVWPYFWTPEDTLREREKRDRAPYSVWVTQGFLQTTPGKSVDYEWAATAIAEILAPHKILALAFDRWRIEFFKKELERIDFEINALPFGQGFKDMSPAIESIEGRVMNRTLRHGNNPVLNMCVNNAKLTQDPAGNKKLDKIKSTGRIDGMVAMVMADGIALQPLEKEPDMTAFLSNPLVFG